METLISEHKSSFGATLGSSDSSEVALERGVIYSSSIFSWSDKIIISITEIHGPSLDNWKQIANNGNFESENHTINVRKVTKKEGLIHNSNREELY